MHSVHCITAMSTLIVLCLIHRLNLDLIIHITIDLSLTLPNSNFKTSFGQWFFRLSVTDWWNSYTNFIIDASQRCDFSWSAYIVYIADYLFNVSFVFYPLL